MSMRMLVGELEDKAGMGEIEKEMELAGRVRIGVGGEELEEGVGGKVRGEGLVAGDYEDGVFAGEEGCDDGEEGGEFARVGVEE